MLKDFLLCTTCLDWMKFVMTKLHAWEQTNLSWGKNFSGPVLIVYYEDLVDDVEKGWLS